MEFWYKALTFMFWHLFHSCSKVSLAFQCACSDPSSEPLLFFRNNMDVPLGPPPRAPPRPKGRENPGPAPKPKPRGPPPTPAATDSPESPEEVPPRRPTWSSEIYCSTSWSPVYGEAKSVTEKSVTENASNPASSFSVRLQSDLVMQIADRKEMEGVNDTKTPMVETSEKVSGFLGL